MRVQLLLVAAGVAFGCCAAPMSGPLSDQPWPWLSAALWLALWTRRSTAVVLAIATALGGAAAAHQRTGELAAYRAFAAELASRDIDTLEGIIAGPVVPLRRGHRLVVSAAGAEVEITAGPATGDRPCPVVSPGDRVRVTGRLRRPRGYRVPGAPSAARLLAARGAQLQMTVGCEHIAVVDHGASRSLWRWPVTVQRRLSEQIDRQGGDATGRAIVRAVVVGDRGGLSDVDAEVVRAAGIAHVLAVSGLHLAVICALLFAVAKRAWAASGLLCRIATPRSAAAWAALVAAAGYGMVTGLRPSTARALLVAAMVLVGVAIDRRVRIADALAIAFAGLLVHRPPLLWDVGFQLSFAACAVLAVALARQPTTASGLARLRDRLLALMRASAWSWLATALIVAAAFACVPAAGLLANLVAVPAVELAVLPLGLAGSALAAVWPAGGGFTIDLSIAVAGAVVDIARLLVGWLPPLEVAPPSWGEEAAFALGVAGLLLRARGFRRGLLVALLGFGVCAGLRLWTSEIAPRLSDELRVTFVDVGQGDAVVVELPGGEVWLIDSGGLPHVHGVDAGRAERLGELPGERAVLPYLRHRRIDHIERVVLTHPHPDHFRGLRAVARSIVIDEVWTALPVDEVRTDGEYARLIAELRARGTRVVQPSLGTVHRRRGVDLTAIWPVYEGPRATADPVMGANDNSLVVRVEYAGRRFLLAGDIELEGEELLVGQAIELTADVVKVPHHGSPTSSMPEFVAAVRPRLAVISCGHQNRFGFPSDEVTDRWQRVGAVVLRTDLSGTITVSVASGGELSVTTTP